MNISKEDNTIIITFEDLPIASIFGTQLYFKIKDIFNFYLSESLYNLMEEYNKEHTKSVIIEVYTTKGKEIWLLIKERIISDNISKFATSHGLKIANGVKEDTIENIYNNTITKETNEWYICYTEDYSTRIPAYWLLLQPKNEIISKDIKNIEDNECYKPISTFESGSVIVHFLNESIKIKDSQYAEFKINKFNESLNSNMNKSAFMLFDKEINLNDTEIITLND